MIRARIPGGLFGGGGGASVTTSDTPPASPADGDLWWDSILGKLFVRYDDANSSQWVPATPTGSAGDSGTPGMSARSYGAVGDGVADDTAALTAALAAASTARQPLIIEPGIYKFTSLVIPAGSVIYAQGATFRSSGTYAVVGGKQLVVGASSTIDELNYSSPGPETFTYAVWLDAGVKIGRLSVSADDQMGPEACHALGQDTYIGYFTSLNCDNALTVGTITIPSTQTTGFKLGGATIKSYRRGIYLVDMAYFNIGPTHFDTRSSHLYDVLPPSPPMYSQTWPAPGQNGFLMGGCQNGNIGDAFIADCGEHAVRIGGSPNGARPTTHVSFGVITAVRTGGCAFKCNPTSLVSPGVTEKAYSISIAGVRGTDIGSIGLNGGVDAGNREGLRLTHARQFRIGWAYFDHKDATHSCHDALLLNDCDDVWIGSLGCIDCGANMVLFHGGRDTDEVNSFGGPIANIVIGGMFGRVPQAIGLVGGAFVPPTVFGVGHFYVSNINLIITTAASTLLDINGANPVTGPIVMKGMVSSANAPLYEGDDYGGLVTYDIQWERKNFSGNPSYANFVPVCSMDIPSLNPANSSANSFYLTNFAGTSALNAYGAGIEFSRLASGRRGAAIAVKQLGANGYETGLAFFTGTGPTAQDALNESMVLDSSKALILRGALSTGAPITKTANFAWAYNENSIIVNNPSGITTVTMYPPASIPGWQIDITNHSAAFTVISASANVVPKTGGAAGTAILPATAGSWARLKSDGVNWITLAAG